MEAAAPAPAAGTRGDGELPGRGDVLGAGAGLALVAADEEVAEDRPPGADDPVLLLELMLCRRPSGNSSCGGNGNGNGNRGGR